MPYAGKKGECIAREVTKCFKHLGQQNVKARIAYRAKRLTSCSYLKDHVQKKHEHNIVYEITCPDCNVQYIGETARKIRGKGKRPLW